MFAAPDAPIRGISRLSARHCFPLAATCLPLLAGCVIAGGSGLSPVGGLLSSDGVAVTPSPSPGVSQPSIVELSANPAMITAPGQEIALTCVGVLSAGVPSYAWSTTGGALSTTQGQTIDWRPPQQSGNYAVTVLVSSPSGGAVTGVFNLTENASGSTSLVDTVPASPTPTPVPTPSPTSSSQYGSGGGNNGGDGYGGDGGDGYGADGGDGYGADGGSSSTSNYYYSTTTTYYYGEGGGGN